VFIEILFFDHHAKSLESGRSCYGFPRTLKLFF